MFFLPGLWKKMTDQAVESKCDHGSDFNCGGYFKGYRKSNIKVHRDFRYLKHTNTFCYLNSKNNPSD